jgi:hypothetical protein
MVRKTTPEKLVAIQAELAHLRHRKRVLDRAITALEAYPAGKMHLCRRLPAGELKTRVAGVA